MKWALLNTQGTKLDDRERCLYHRMGILVSRNQDRRPIIKDIESDAHELSETAAATSGMKRFAKDEHNILIHLKMANTTALTYQ